MIYQNAVQFSAEVNLAHWPQHSPGTPQAVFMVLPEAFALAAESATDNTYMQSCAVNAERALAQALGLAQALRQAGVCTLLFPGDVTAPDGVFPNNVFATAPGRYLTGAMRHPVRQREATRPDLQRFFREVLGRNLIDLRKPGVVAELTGSLVIDRSRELGFCGLSERCNLAGAQAMHEAFSLQGSLVFQLAASEYHTNVVLSALAGRGVVLAPSGFADPAYCEAIAGFYQPHAIWLDDAEKAAFAGNCIALKPDQLWLSERAVDGLRAANRSAIEKLGFNLCSVPLDELEKAGGSLRCMIGEIY